ncbi:MAG TPA: YwiC-like family protein [Limnochordales bacterium]|nr:YwiC-like family protein [Limnochordales bacterium]
MARARHPESNPAASAVLTGRSRRAASLFIPREHGSWGMLLTVLILPPAALGTRGAAWWFVGAAAVLFFARRPWEIWLQTAPRPDGAARAAALVLTLLGLALGATGLRAAPTPAVFLLAVLAAGLAGFSAYSESLPQRRGAVAGRLAGAAGMVSLLLLQTAAAFGAVPPAGWTLGALCLAYFLTSGLRVRSLVRARKVEGFRRISVAVHGAVLAGAAAAALAGAAPPLAPAAFAPGLVQAVRILGRGPAPVNTLRMGIGEILHAAAFVVLTIAAYRLSGI